MLSIKGPLAFVKSEHGCGVVRVTVRNPHGVSGFVVLWFEGESSGTKLPLWFTGSIWTTRKLHEL